LIALVVLVKLSTCEILLRLDGQLTKEHRAF
jgi:hypothetical protein